MTAWWNVHQDFAKPIITVAVPYTNATPCNHHLRMMGDIIEKRVEELGGKAFVFGTPVVSDGETTGLKGMNYSLISRDLICDCIETMHEVSLPCSVRPHVFMCVLIDMLLRLMQQMASSRSADATKLSLVL